MEIEATLVRLVGDDDLASWWRSLLADEQAGVGLRELELRCLPSRRIQPWQRFLLRVAAAWVLARFNRQVRRSRRVD